MEQVRLYRREDGRHRRGRRVNTPRQHDPHVRIRPWRRGDPPVQRPAHRGCRFRRRSARNGSALPLPGRDPAGESVADAGPRDGRRAGSLCGQHRTADAAAVPPDPAAAPRSPRAASRPGCTIRAVPDDTRAVPSDSRTTGVPAERRGRRRSRRAGGTSFRRRPHGSRPRRALGPALRPQGEERDLHVHGRAVPASTSCSTPSPSSSAGTVRPCPSRSPGT